MQVAVLEHAATEPDGEEAREEVIAREIGLIRKVRMTHDVHRYLYPASDFRGKALLC